MARGKGGSKPIDTPMDKGHNLNNPRKVKRSRGRK